MSKNNPLCERRVLNGLLSVDGTLANAIDIGTPSVHASLLPNKKGTLRLSPTIPASVVAGPDHLIAKIDPNHTLGDTNLTNNIIVSLQAISIS